MAFTAIARGVAVLREAVRDELLNGKNVCTLP